MAKKKDILKKISKIESSSDGGFKFNNIEYAKKELVEGAINRNYILDSNSYLVTGASSKTYQLSTDLDDYKNKDIYISLDASITNVLTVTDITDTIKVELVLTFSDTTTNTYIIKKALTVGESLSERISGKINITDTKTISSAVVNIYSNFTATSVSLGRPKLELGKLSIWNFALEDLSTELDKVKALKGLDPATATANGLMVPTQFNKLAYLNSTNANYEATTTSRGYMSANDKTNLNRLVTLEQYDNIAYGTYTSDINPTISSYTKYKVDINELANNIDKNYYISCNYSGITDSTSNTKYIYLYLKVTFANGNTYTRGSAVFSSTVASTQVSGIIQTTDKITSTDITNYGNITDAYVYAYKSINMTNLTISNMKVEFGGYTTWCPARVELGEISKIVKETTINRNYVLNSDSWHTKTGGSGGYAFSADLDLNKLKGKKIYMSLKSESTGLTTTTTSLLGMVLRLYFTDGTSQDTEITKSLSGLTSYSGRFTGVIDFYNGTKTINNTTSVVYMYTTNTTGAIKIGRMKVELYSNSDWSPAPEDLNPNNLVVPTASSTTLGGIKVGNYLSILNSILSANTVTTSGNSSSGYFTVEGKFIITWSVVSSVPTSYTWTYPISINLPIFAAASLHLASAGTSWALNQYPGSSSCAFLFSNTCYRVFFVAIGILA